MFVGVAYRVVGHTGTQERVTDSETSHATRKERSKFVRRAAAVTQEFAFGPSPCNFHRIITSVTAVTLYSAKPLALLSGPLPRIARNVNITIVHGQAPQ